MSRRPAQGQDTSRVMVSEATIAGCAEAQEAPPGSSCSPANAESRPRKHRGATEISSEGGVAFARPSTRYPRKAG